jgi:hypothetical protein
LHGDKFLAKEIKNIYNLEMGTKVEDCNAEVALDRESRNDNLQIFNLFHLLAATRVGREVSIRDGS